MPTILKPEMTAIEILSHVLAAYGDPNHYESQEKEYGEPGQFTCQREPWVLRDRGDYARTAVNLVTAKMNAGLP